MGSPSQTRRGPPAGNVDNSNDNDSLDNTQLSNARDIATVREENQADNRTEPSNTAQSDFPSDVSDLIDEGIRNMSDTSPEIVTSSESTSLNTNKGMKYKIDSHIDPSLILQGNQKRKRSPTENNVANTTTFNDALNDSFSNWQLAREQKKRDRDEKAREKKKQDPKKK